MQGYSRKTLERWLSVLLFYIPLLPFLLRPSHLACSLFLPCVPFSSWSDFNFTLFHLPPSRSPMSNFLFPWTFTSSVWNSHSICLINPHEFLRIQVLEWNILEEILPASGNRVGAAAEQFHLKACWLFYSKLLHVPHDLLLTQDPSQLPSFSSLLSRLLYFPHPQTRGVSFTVPIIFYLSYIMFWFIVLLWL